MRTMTIALPLAALLVAAGGAQAQDSPTRDSAPTQVASEPTDPIDPIDPIDPTGANRVLDIIDLPRVAEEARESGVADEDIRIILKEAGDRKMAPAETESILRECGAAARESGPVDNFGAFVQSRLAEGMHGPELAAAIHEEHRLHGKGKGHGKVKGKVHRKREAHGKGSHDKGSGQADKERKVEGERRAEGEAGVRDDGSGKAVKGDADRTKPEGRGDHQKKRKGGKGK